MKWVDVYDIAIELEEKYPKIDVAGIRFTDLREKVIKLPSFDDDINKCNEKVLEAIQAAWLEERE